MRAIRNAATIRSNPSELRLFLDVYSDNFGDRHATRDPLAIASATGSPETNTIMIFLKHFDPKKQRIISLCKAYVQVEDFVHQSLTPTICERMKWPAETVLQFFEEIKPGMIESIGSNKTFSQAEIQNGDIICSQLEISETE
jgi:ubiquitin carboxyl-terminal hydrolase 7